AELAVLHDVRLQVRLDRSHGRLSARCPRAVLQARLNDHQRVAGAIGHVAYLDVPFIAEKATLFILYWQPGRILPYASDADVLRQCWRIVFRSLRFALAAEKNDVIRYRAPVFFGVPGLR